MSTKPRVMSWRVIGRQPYVAAQRGLVSVARNSGAFHRGGPADRKLLRTHRGQFHSALGECDGGSEPLARVFRKTPAKCAVSIDLKTKGRKTMRVRRLAMALLVSTMAVGASGQETAPGAMAGAADAAIADARDDAVAAYDRGDYAVALKLLTPLAEQGDVFAQFSLGVMYENGQGVIQDARVAVKWYRLSADQGNASAQDNLGFMYANGKGVSQDEAEAVKWHRLAADQGYTSAQFNLGVMYENGRGVMPDARVALNWYRLAAEQGNASAQYNLGFMYANGQGVTQDYAEAVKWFRFAADQGKASAAFNLGLMYAKGRGVIQDNAEAVKWFRFAAQRGHGDAQFNLGVTYGIGEGVTQDYVRAHVWFDVAAAAGAAGAAANRDIAALKMTPQQIAEAQKLARECLASNYKNCGETPAARPKAPKRR